MGRVCAWCGIVLRGAAASPEKATGNALCSGCLEELRAALLSTGMHLKDRRLSRSGC